MENWIILYIHIAFTCGISIGMLRLGERALNAWLCVVAICMNLFVTKQISIGFLEVTATDALAASYLLGLCLIQENFGKRSARMHVLFSFLCSVGFLGLSFIHLWYVPGEHDVMHPLFVTLLDPMPRLIIASLTSFVVIQLIDVSIFQWLREKMKGHFFPLRAAVCLILANLSDTILFSYLGLYGMVAHLWDIIFFSLLIKIIATAISIPFASFAQFCTRRKIETSSPMSKDQLNDSTFPSSLSREYYNTTGPPA